MKYSNIQFNSLFKDNLIKLKERNLVLKAQLILQKWENCNTFHIKT